MGLDYAYSRGWFTIMCLVTKNPDGSFVQICNCEHGSENCENNEWK